MSLSDGGTLRVCGGDTCPADGLGGRSDGGQWPAAYRQEPSASCCLLTKGMLRPLRFSWYILKMGFE